MIFSNWGAFVALLKNGQFVAWGWEEDGGKITDEIQTKLRNVKLIFSSNRAFAAVLNDGSVFAWGDSRSGGKISDVQSRLMKNVKIIIPQSDQFIAICENGNCKICFPAPRSFFTNAKIFWK